MRKAHLCLPVLFLLVLLLPALALAEKPDPPTLNFPVIDSGPFSGTCVPGAVVKGTLSGATISNFSYGTTDDGTWEADIRFNPGETTLTLYQIVGGEQSDDYIYVFKGQPGPPTNLQAIPGNQKVTLTWEAPSYEGFSPVHEYEIVIQESAGAPVGTTTASATEAVIEPLTSGTTYQFSVYAINGEGKSDIAASLSVTTPPDAPTGLSALPGDKSADLSWYGSTDPSIIGFIIREVDGKRADETVDSPTANRLYMGSLTNGEAYHFEIYAVNSAVESAPGVFPAVRPNARPNPPQNVRATAGDRSITITWDPPLPGDGTVDYYMAHLDGTTTNIGIPSPLSHTFTGLTNGQSYNVGLRTGNNLYPDNGTGNFFDVTPDIVPNAPENLTATAGDRSVTLQWQPPIDNGGTPVLGYEYSLDGVTWTPTDTDASTTVTGLQNGTAYTFLVRAFNTMDPGTMAPVNETPNIAPNAPQSPWATAGNGSATLTWQAPLPFDGSVAGYEVTADNWFTTYNAGAALSFPFTGLQNGTEYTLAVRAYNSAGKSGEVSAKVTPAGNPTMPQNVTATAGIESATLQWSAPTDTGGSPLLGYRVSGDGALWQDLPATADTHTFTGLTSGQPYTLYVKAFTAVSESPAATAQVTPLGNSDDILLTIDPVYEYDPYITGTCEEGSQIYLVFGGSARRMTPYLGAGSLAPLPGTPASVTGTRWSYDVSGLSLRAGDPVTVIQTVGGVTKNILRATVATRTGTLPPVTVNPPAPGDTSLTGTAIPGATVTVTGPDGTPIGSVDVDWTGNWTYPLPAPVQEDDVYLVNQTVGPLTSAPAPAGLSAAAAASAAAREFEAPPSGYGVITGSRVNARERPSLDATVLTQLSQGTRVRIVDWGMTGDDGSGPWCKITVGDQMYFVHNDYVDGTAPF